MLKTQQIMALEEVLRILENNNPGRDQELYYLVVYGTPADTGKWSWSFEGHHLSLNFTIVNGHVSTSPVFMGTNPAEIRQGPNKGQRVLGKEEDLAFILMQSLPEKLRKKAIFKNQAPADIFTGQKSRVSPLEPVGISYHELKSDGKQKLKELIEEYITVMPADLAAVRRAKLEAAGWDPIHFAWAGPVEKGKGHYYRIQGPTFLIEFDNVQNNANHIHSVWRDFDGDFGRDLLKEHYHHAH